MVAPGGWGGTEGLVFVFQAGNAEDGDGGRCGETPMTEALEYTLHGSKDFILFSAVFPMPRQGLTEVPKTSE